MKTTVVGLIAGSALAVAVFFGTAFLGSDRGSQAVAQRTGVADPNADLITIATALSENSKSQQLTVIDPRTRVMSVYHVDLASGAISLKSVRNIQWDLHLVDFNGASPLPREVKAQLESQQR
ncbi:MAG: hypothetical protein SGJ20_10350 [Planctomycetota bacterium]|nr:hypothetical protein [Planctomycetota bacterium]